MRILIGENRQTVLVTGATGFIGAHIVDVLLRRGVNVKAATRSLAKAQSMKESRPQYADKLQFVEIGDFGSPTGLNEAVRGVDGIIHTASVSAVTSLVDSPDVAALYL